MSKILRFFKNLSFYDRLFITTFLLIAFFSYYRIGKASINNDAQFWYTRTQRFITEVKNHRWERTLQNPKPGITVYWLSGLSLETFLNLYEWKFGFRPSIWTYETFPLTHFAVIAPLVTVSLAFIVVFYLIISNLFSKKIAFYSVVLFGLQPFYIGLSRNFHADSTVTAFMGISMLLLLYFLKSAKFRWLILSGICAGLALLSKSSAVYLIPYFFLALVIDFLFEHRHSHFYVKSFILWIFFCSITFFILLPDMWVEPLENLKVIFVNEGLFLAFFGRDGTVSNTNFYGTLLGYLGYLEPLWRDLTFPLFLSFLIGGIFSAYKVVSHNGKTIKYLLLISTYPLFYFIQMSLVSQKMDRYLLPLVPFLGFLGGYFLANLEGLFHSSSKKYFVSGVLLLNLGFVFYYFPNYLLYPSIKGKDQFGCSLCSDIGEYFNSKPNGDDLKIVITSNKVHRMRPFVRGKVYTKNEELPSNWTPEYLVIAEHESLPSEYPHCVLETEIGFKGVPYWKIFRCK